MIDLEAIKRRCEAATPPPWVNTGGRFPKINGGPKGGCDVATLFFADGNDGDFMAHAREDVPALVAEVERLVLALDHERDVVAAYQQAQDGLTAEIERMRETKRLEKQWHSSLDILDDAERKAKRKWTTSRSR